MNNNLLVRYLILVIFLTIQFSDAYKNLPSVCPKILDYKVWDGITPKMIQYAIFPLEFVVIHHTVTDACKTRDYCSSIVRNIQEYHMNDLDFDNIGYNFLIGSDGNVYEGSGWHTVGAHTIGYNSLSMGLGLIGNFTSNEPTDIQLTTTKNFLKCALELGELDSDYKLIGGRQVISTLSPGRKLYHIIKTWPNFEKNPKRKNTAN